MTILYTRDETLLRTNLLSKFFLCKSLTYAFRFKLFTNYKCITTQFEFRTFRSTYFSKVLSYEIIDS